MTQAKRTEIQYTAEQFKLISLFFANMEILAATIEAVKGTPFYNTVGKRLIGQLKAELLKHVRITNASDPSILFSEQFNLSKMLTNEFLQTVLSINVNNYLEFATLLKSYRDGKVRFEDEPKNEVTEQQNEDENIPS